MRTAGFTALADVEPVAYDDFFLIGDLLTSRMNFLTGEPKAGKSLFAAGMLRALLEGHTTFLGQPVRGQLKKVVYGYSDDGADAELRERFAGTDALGRVSVVPVWDFHSENNWHDLRADLVDSGADLFVLDTMLGSLLDGEDISSGMTAQATIARLRLIADAGITVLAVTHTPKGNSEGLSVPSSVMGGRALAAGVRAVIALRKDSRGRHVQTAINRAREDLNLRVTVDRESPGSEVPVWRLLGEVETNAVDWRAELVRLVVEENPEETAAKAIGLRYGQRVGMRVDTVRRAVPEVLFHNGEKWAARRQPSHRQDVVVS